MLEAINRSDIRAYSPKILLDVPPCASLYIMADITTKLHVSAAMPVEFEFTGIKMVIDYADKERVIAEFNRSMGKRHEEYLASPEGILAALEAADNLTKNKAELKRLIALVKPLAILR